MCFLFVFSWLIVAFFNPKVREFLPNKTRVAKQGARVSESLRTTDRAPRHKMCPDHQRPRITIGYGVGMKTGAIETGGNGCGSLIMSARCDSRGRCSYVLCCISPDFLVTSTTTSTVLVVGTHYQNTAVPPLILVLNSTSSIAVYGIFIGLKRRPQQQSERLYKIRDV